MDSTNEGDEPQGFQRHHWLSALSTIQMIAETMRAEFGVSIDAHPGGVGVEAGTMNRALRISAWVILVDAGNEGDDSFAVQGWVLRQVALGRLYDLGLIGPRAESLLDQEPKLGDAWLAYIALAPESVIDDLMGKTPFGSPGV
jgi:hypothetical protein